MKELVVGAFLFAALAGAAVVNAPTMPTPARWRVVEGMRFPDPAVTPGAVVAGMTAARVCSILWGKDSRHVSQAMKRRVCAAYGAQDCPGPRWEVDHWVPRELGGADDPANLWPEPIAQARQKDRVETALHRRVCAGTMTLEAARAALSRWPAVLKELGR